MARFIFPGGRKPSIQDFNDMQDIALASEEKKIEASFGNCVLSGGNITINGGDPTKFDLDATKSFIEGKIIDIPAQVANTPGGAAATRFAIIRFEETAEKTVTISATPFDLKADDFFVLEVRDTDAGAGELRLATLNMTGSNIDSIDSNLSNIRPNIPDNTTIQNVDGSNQKSLINLIFADAKYQPILSEIALPYNGLPNSDFEIWNEGTVFAAIVDGTYFAELYRYGNSTGAVHQIQRVADSPTFGESSINSTFSPEIKVTTSSGAPLANQVFTIQKIFQGFDIKDWLGRNIVISFWTKAKTPGIFCFALRNSGSTRSFVKEYTINAANTWERKSIPLFFDPEGVWNIGSGIGVVFSWTLAVGADFIAPSDNSWHDGLFFATANQINFNNITNDTFKMTLPQNDLGLIRRAFNKLPIDQDANHMRKFIQIYPNLRYVTEKDGPLKPFEWAFPFPVAMRAAPAVSASNVTFDNSDTLTFNNISGTNLNVGLLSAGGATSQAMAVQFDIKLDSRF